MTEFSFLGLEFAPLRPDDFGSLSEFLSRRPQRLTGYTFSMLAAWQPLFRYNWTFASPDLLLISCILDDSARRHLLQPVGSLSPETARTILTCAEALPYPLKLVGVSDRFLRDSSSFTQSFAVAEDRAVSNYIYSAQALAQLPGRKYSKKRNLISQASNQYSWTCRPIEAALVNDCFSVLESILDEEKPVVEGMLKMELSALECTLRNFEKFRQQGLLISVNGRPVAFSIYESISPTTVAIHFERALRSYKGLYQVINCETAKIIAAQGYEFINREEDLGNEGLRDAKMSYHPIEIAPSYELTFQSHAPKPPPDSSHI